MASLLKLFLTLEPSLRFYLRSQRIAEIHEALLSSLLVCQPEDPNAWLISCLTELHSLPASVRVSINWDYFIPEIYRPVDRPVNIESSLSYVFAVCDNTLEPNEKQIRIAIEHYKLHIQRDLLSAWLRYYLTRLGQKRWLEKREQAANEYYRMRALNIFFRQWSQWGLFEEEHRYIYIFLFRVCSSTSSCTTESGCLSSPSLRRNLSITNRAQ